MLKPGLHLLDDLLRKCSEEKEKEKRGRECIVSFYDLSPIRGRGGFTDEHPFIKVLQAFLVPQFPISISCGGA